MQQQKAMSEKHGQQVTDADDYDAESGVQGTPKSTKNRSKIVLGAGPAPTALILLHQGGQGGGGEPQLGDRMANKLQKNDLSGHLLPQFDVP